MTKPEDHDIFMPVPRAEFTRVRVERVQRFIYRDALLADQALLGYTMEDLLLDPDTPLGTATQSLVRDMARYDDLPRLLAGWKVGAREQRTEHRISIFVDGMPVVGAKDI